MLPPTLVVEGMRVKRGWFWAGGAVAVIAVVAGVALGLGAFTFVYARGHSYLTDDPAACANCHVMDAYYDGWLKSSHHTVATCNDCHTPTGFVAKYAVKAINGWNHSLAFTTGNYIEPLQVTANNRAVARQSCLKCHATLVHALALPARDEADDPLPQCTHCHGAVGHPR